MDISIFNKSAIEAFEQLYRATFINSLGGFKSLVIVGTKSLSNITNLAPFSSFFHIGAHPALFGLIFRPGTEERHTLSNIIARQQFTVNHVHASMYVQAHQASARFPAGNSEFTATGLTEAYEAGIDAPFVQESRIRIGAVMREKIDIALNGTTLLLSEIMHVSMPADCLQKDGFVDLEKAGTLTCSGLDSYHQTERLARLTYAKPGSWPQAFDTE
ncbi:flavin oxidoreductase [Niastella koreensis]|uniref:Flavin reductase like domain-containing protein n=2 Tax=Niastella koreensis TaxID=354356 RepID=G8TKG1_NIAKG|nr:flavin reductase [Niastella koreensis]AEV97617.1 hypothetical protein Niako_1243 [Niastella koreensis GR20-10]OQP44210.1 flavin oxidoreductase [Niastella koreensis]